MSDILIRNVEPELRRLIEESARTHRRSLSEEVKARLRQASGGSGTTGRTYGLGTRIRNSIPEEFRVELELPPRDSGRDPPDFS